MRTETCIVTIYASPEVSQDVDIEYEIMPSNLRDWEVSALKVLDVITIEPEDLMTDLREAIAFEENIPSWRLVIDCKVEHTISAEQTVKA
jgi:hypothetical protein